MSRDRDRVKGDPLPPWAIELMHAFTVGELPPWAKELGFEEPRRRVRRQAKPRRIDPPSENP
jgi:hypothetical protein